MCRRITSTPGVISPSSIDLTVVKSDSLDPVGVGGSLTYTLTVTISGVYGSQAITLTDSLPASVTFVAATSTHGVCNESGGTLTCNLGSLPELSATVTVEVTVPEVAGTISNSAAVSAFNTFDLNPADNSATETTAVLTPEAVPGPSQWGIVALALVLTGLAYLVLRRRSVLRQSP